MPTSDFGPDRSVAAEPSRLAGDVAEAATFHHAEDPAAPIARAWCFAHDTDIAAQFTLVLVGNPPPGERPSGAVPDVKALTLTRSADPADVRITGQRAVAGTRKATTRGCSLPEALRLRGGAVQEHAHDFRQAPALSGGVLRPLAEVCARPFPDQVAAR